MSDSGLRPRYPAVEIYRVAADTTVTGGAPYLADIDQMPRIDGGPEALLRLDERRRLTGQPPLGPALMTADAVAAGLPVPLALVTDTPLGRETDYGRVDDHSSAIRAAGDTRHTFNRVPDYPTPGAETVYGAWTGGRLTASSSSSDSTALPDVATAASPAAAIDADSATAWVSNALQSAVGQWLQVDFDQPVTNSVITITPSATTVGAQVRRMEIETATGTTTLRFDEAGKPVAAALPYGETPWVRITAVGTDDGSPGVQFAITDLSITQYDAKGYAHPINVRHTALVPAAPPHTAVAQWDLGTEPLGRPGCAEGPGDPVTMQCAPSMALAPESPASFSRTLSVPTPMPVVPTIWVRARSGPKLADLVAAPDTTQAHGDSDSVDVLGAAYAATDGDPSTAWTAPQRVVQHKSPPTLTLTLPRPTEVTGLRLTPASSPVPAHPTMVAVDLGDGPQVRALEVSGSQTVSLKPRVTDTVTVSVLDWKDVIDRTALGFDQLKPPGLAEVAALGTDGRPIAVADTAHNRVREVTVDCEHGPIVAIAGRFVHTEVHTTVGALLDGVPVRAQPCDSEPIQLPAGQQELVISPGPQFVVDGAALAGPLAAQSTTATSTPRDHRRMGSGPTRGPRPGSEDVAGVGRAGKHQPRLGGPHQHRRSVAAVGSQRLAAGMGATGRNVGHHHAQLRPQLAVPGRPGRWAGTVAAAGPAGMVAATAPARRFRALPAVDAGTVGRRAGAGRRRRHRRSDRPRPLRRRPGTALGAADASTSTRAHHTVVERRWTDPGRRHTVPPPVALGRRIRRAFRGSAIAGIDLHRRTGRLNSDT